MYNNNTNNKDEDDIIFVEPARGYSAPSYTIPSLAYWNPILRSRANKLIIKRRKLSKTYTTPLLQPSASTTTTGGIGGGEGGGIEGSTNEYVAGGVENHNDEDDDDDDDDGVDFTGTTSPTFNSNSSTAREMRMFIKEFYKTIYTNERQEYYRRVRERLPEVNQYYMSLVKNDATMMPIVTMEQFWQRYEWRVGDGSVERVMKELQEKDKNEKAKTTKQREEQMRVEEQKRQTEKRLAEQQREEERLQRLERAVEEQRAKMEMKNDDANTNTTDKKKEKDPVAKIRHDDDDDPPQKMSSPPAPARPSSSNTEQSKKQKKNVLQDMFRQDEQHKRREAQQMQVGLRRFARNFHAFTGALTSDDNLQKGTDILEKKLEHIADETIQNNLQDKLHRQRQQQSDSSSNDDDEPDPDSGDGGGATSRQSDILDVVDRFETDDPKTSSSPVEEESTTFSSNNKLISTTVLLVLWAATSVIWLGPVIQFARNPRGTVAIMTATSYNMLCGPVGPGWYIDLDQIGSTWRRRTGGRESISTIYTSPYWWSLHPVTLTNDDNDEGAIPTMHIIGYDAVCSRMLSSLSGSVDSRNLLPPDGQSHLQIAVSPNFRELWSVEIQIFVDTEKSALASSKKKKAKRKIQYKRSSLFFKNTDGGLTSFRVSWDGMYIIETRLTRKMKKREIDPTIRGHPLAGFVETRTKFVAPWAVDTTKLTVGSK